MPNGGYDGSIEDFHKIEAPLIEIDPLLAQFADANKLKVVKNYHNWPQLSLVWTPYPFIHRPGRFTGQ